ncbi:MAG: hypothetical protein ACOH1T_00870 [Microbacteriaceae bacterium]
MPVLKRIVVWGALLGVAIAVIGSIIGIVIDGQRGLVSALVGAVIAFLFMAITAGSVLLAIRVGRGDILHPAFFSIVLGGWLLKFIVFLVLIIVLKDQPWINTVVLFLTIVIGIAGSLIVDVVVIAKSRMPYVSDVALPGDADTEQSATR